jgi:hypothetical protein
VFLDDAGLKELWGGQRTYLLVYGTDMRHLEELLGKGPHVIATSGGNYLLCNR